MSILNKALSRIPINIIHVAKYSVNVADGTSSFIFKSNFTPEEQEKVLNILNRCNNEQLASFSVSQTRIRNLETWKTKRGPFRSLSEVLEVDGLGEKVLEKICENIISDNTHDQIKLNVNNVINKRLKQLVSPPLAKNVIDNIRSTVGIHLGPVGISWAKISRDQNILNNWNCENFISLPKKLLPVDTFNLAVQITRKLPSGDIYVLEANSPVSPQASNVVSYNQHLELTSMLIALLNTSVRHNCSIQKTASGITPSKSIENMVYYLRAKAPARLFKTLVGNERVSALTIVTELIENNGTSKIFSLPCTPINVNEHLRNAFFSQTAANKELLGQALMLSVAFMDLCVYKNPISMVAIAPAKNNKL